MKRAQRGLGPVHGTFQLSGASLSYLAEPPSFAAISDPNVVVSLKNVLKKDSITKAKGLEELVAYAQSHSQEQDGGVDEPLLDVWTQIYARISIDNSRRVRELSHILQLSLLRSARKRMERHVPKTVGPWLAGNFDRDRGVARAANEGLSSFLTTPEKMTAFWLKCQSQILDFATEAIRETQETLSDGRSTTFEDAQAKYFRVVTSSLALVLRLLQTIDDQGVERLQTKYNDYFAEDAVWKSITFDDATVRKTVCQLLFACLDRQLVYGTSTRARLAFVTGGLKTSQAGSALEFVKALTKLTQHDPSIWLSAPGDRKPPLNRLYALISRGSQGSPPKFWEALGELLALLSAQVVNLGAASSLLSSIKSGITNREEPRTNTSYSWKCFIDVARAALSQLTDEDKLAIAKEQLLPLFGQFMIVSAEPIVIPTGPTAMSILTDAHLALIQSSSKVRQALDEEWQRLGSALCETMSASLPEVAQEYETSQNNMAEQGRRWFGLVGQISGRLQEAKLTVPDQTVAPSREVLSRCYSLLRSRNMKPFGAARMIEYALSTSQHLFNNDRKSLFTFLQQIADEDFDKVAESRSFEPLNSCVAMLGSDKDTNENYQKLWQSWMGAALRLSSRAAQLEALTGLLSQDSASDIAQANDGLQETLYAHAQATLNEDYDARGVLEASLAHHTIRDNVLERLTVEVAARLAVAPRSAEKSHPVLSMIQLIAKSRPDMLTQGSTYTDIVAHLLALSEISDTSVSPIISSIQSILDGQVQSKYPVVDIVRENLNQAGPNALGIQTLRSQAESAVQKGAALLEDIIPDTAIWEDHFAPFLKTALDPVLSITSNIEAAMTLPKLSNSVSQHVSVPRDRDDRSITARMALFTAGLMEKNVGHLQLSHQRQVEVLYLQCLAMHLTSDQITLMSRGGLWQSLESPDAFSEAEDFIASLRRTIDVFVQSSSGWITATATKSEPASIIRGLVDLAVERCRAMTPGGAYSARILSELLQSLVEAHGMSGPAEEHLLKLEYLKAKPDTALLAAAIITGFGNAARPTKAVNNFCNRLVSDVAAAQAGEAEAPLVLLALTARVYETGELPVANNRIVFAVRQITSWLEDTSELDAALCASVCNALAVLLPCMKDIYGSYWEITLNFCASLCTGAATGTELYSALPSVHAALKLVRTLESITEPNDDLEDALKEFASSKAKTFLELLRIDRTSSSQPMAIIDGMLCREVEKLPLSRLPASEELFSLVASESQDIQTAAFGLLHRKIPAEQGQKSVDVLLDKTNARLPDELLSLFLDPPTLEKFPDEILVMFPVSIRSYLLTWKLVFDAYASSQFKIRDDYTEQLKSENLIDPLMDFMFDVLGHSAAHPLNLDRANLCADQICEFDIKVAEAETGEQSLHWLLVHLFYLTLKFVPGLFRSWYIKCRSKQTRIAVESWTAKYISPIISREALDTVERWAETQRVTTATDKELVVKISRPAKEITAGFEIDESHAAIVIKVPPNYPIDGVTVSSVSRVAVTERKWQSWIMTTQGAITLYNGNIIDGLQVFKRNVVAALDGQSECAICYSIISTDKHMPDKRCTTCNHSFHRTCLYKWFQTSNQNSCPLCRNPIDYLGADTARRRQ